MEQILVITVSPKAAKVIEMMNAAVSKSPTGVTFLSIKSYCNQYGEVSDQLINIGQSYKNAVEKDIKFLEELDIQPVMFKSAMVDILAARTALIESFKNPDENRSKGQLNAYTVITDGLKVHNETGKLYIYGFRVHKQVLQEGSYPIRNKKKLTIAKDELRKLLRTDKYVNFSIEVGNEIRTNGDTIEL